MKTKCIHGNGECSSTDKVMSWLGLAGRPNTDSNWQAKQD